MNKVSLNEGSVIIDKDNLDLVYKDCCRPYSNNNNVHYKIIVLRRGIAEPFTINYEEDK